MDVRAEEAKITGVLHMAFDFSSMARTFEKGTKDKFLKRIHAMLPMLADVESQDTFEFIHGEVCNWGCRSLKPSHSGRRRASYGQVAKTLNVVLKVAVYYCGLPNRRQAMRLLPWLHPAIDNPMMKYLGRRYRAEFPNSISAISNVDKRTYKILLNFAARDVMENLGGKLHPVQWEDIVWVKANTKK